MAETTQKKANKVEGNRKNNNASKKDLWTKKKLEKAGQDQFDVISRRAPDTNDFVALLNNTDNLVLQVRLQMERRENLTAEKVSVFIKRYQKIREDLNAFNAEMSSALGYTYTPPRGMSVPVTQSTESTN